MKILMVTRYIYDARREDGMVGSGLAIIVSDLVKELGNSHRVFLMTHDRICEAFVNHNIKNISEKYYSEEGFALMIKKISPDIVHFHYIDDYTIRMMEFCSKYKIPFLITFHLYVGDTNISGRERKTSEMEKRVLSIPGLYATCVSSGIKRKIIRDYPFMDNRIDVILNAVNVKRSETFQHKSYETIIGLSVGTICERKNQIMLLEAVNKLPKEICKRFKLIFIGRDRLQGQLSTKIGSMGLGDICEYIGEVPRNEIVKYYEKSDMLICSSELEGFSLSVLEAMSYGLSIVIPSELDFVDDLHDKEGMYFCDEMTPECFADRISECIEDIPNNGRYYRNNKKTLKDMAVSYEKKYHMLINKELE